MEELKKLAIIMPKGAPFRYNKGSLSAPDSIALPVLASLIPEELDIQVEIYDESIEKIEKEKINVDIVAIFAATPEINRAYKYAEYFKSKGTTVVIGGSHTTLCPDESLLNADSVICGIFLYSWPQLLRDYVSGSLKKIYTQSEAGFSGLPLPSLDVYKEKYSAYDFLNHVQLNYGCFNKSELCTECKDCIRRPMDEVVRDIKHIKASLVEFSGTDISDDEYSKELCNAIAPLKKKWIAYSSINIADNEELLELVAKSGCRILFIRFEPLNSGEKFLDAVKKIRQKGIMIAGNFVFGLDTDDKDVFKKTADFINKANIDIAKFSIATPLPGTAFYEQMRVEGRIIEADWSMYDFAHVVFQPKNMTPEELQNGFYWAWKETYRPINILNKIIRLKSLNIPMLVSNIASHIRSKKLDIYSRDVMTDCSDI